MKISKLVSAALASLTLLSCSAAVGVSAVDSLKVDGEKNTDGTFYFELINGSYTITSCEASAIFENIPELRNGYPVTALGENALANCTFIEKLTIPDSITSISDNAFAGCSSLKEVTLPKKIDRLSSGIFAGCNSLQKIDIPDNVTTIESYAFYNCSMLTDVELPASLKTIEPMAFAECSSIENIDAGNCADFTVKDGILYDSKKTKIYRASTQLSGDVYIDDGVASIEPGAFSVCVRIENLFLPITLANIGDDAFGYCTGLKTIDFSEGLTDISAIAFKNCVSLQALDLPTTLKRIGDGAFYNCTSLSRVIIPEGTDTLGDGVFVNCPSLSQTSIPKSVTSVGENAFGYMINDEGEYELEEGFKLSVFSGSEGAKYARSNGINASNVDRDLKAVAFIVIAVGLILTAVVFAIVLMARSRKGAPMSVRKADKLAKEKEEEENYKSII